MAPLGLSPELKTRSGVLPRAARGDWGTSLEPSSSEEDASDSSEMVRKDTPEEIEVGELQSSGIDPMEEVRDLIRGGVMAREGLGLLPPEAR